MTTILMMTAPWTNATRKMWKMMISALDVHKWILGHERGKDGYEHLQARLRVSKGKEEAFTAVKQFFPQAHIEEASDTWEYEAKEGRYRTSWDTRAIVRTRYMPMRIHQREWMERIMAGGDRTVSVIYDKNGNHGKSWMVNHLFEQHRAYYVPPTVSSVKDMIQWVSSGYDGQPIILIDIPRTWSWSDDLVCAIETIKDGLVYDTRYHAQFRNIRGVKVAVMCNTKPKLGKLSVDRWDIITVGEGPKIEGSLNLERARPSRNTNRALFPPFRGGKVSDSVETFEVYNAVKTEHGWELMKPF